ncbi:hypothetical protein [Brevundimonas sp.]|uniref:hypothetical protein n=1 Tax=Brevundimonas sp. TaxID=1871086 RepID=UPI00272F8A1E|nr:hypothetical protein [Brevundimonas sp.]MDP1914301.1 hypothetical protein [Brevundimonas sp.]
MAEYDAAGTLLRRYVHADGADVPLVWYEGAMTAAPQGAVICGWPLRCKCELGLMSGSVGVRSSVRPVGAALMSAGPDGVR